MLPIIGISVISKIKIIIYIFFLAVLIKNILGTLTFYTRCFQVIIFPK